MAQIERDFPVGHPKAADTVLGSPEHRAWIIQHSFHENKRDFPLGHPAAIDTPGNMNHVVWEAGVDPRNPHLEAHTGLQPEAAAAVAAWNAEEAKGAHESPVVKPLDANVVLEALAAERERLNVEVLDSAQYNAVLEQLHAAPVA
jgi:hypothetical protein